MGTDEIGNTHFSCLPRGPTRLALPSSWQLSGEIPVPDGTAQMSTFERFSPRTTNLDPERVIERTEECFATGAVCATSELPALENAANKLAAQQADNLMLLTLFFAPLFPNINP
jgi:hypothetical protein